ncbi:MAG: hypothetical protein ACI9DM_002199 [Cyclobacteriaceae bacterium]|jgi:hypothetical protein
MLLEISDFNHLREHSEDTFLSYVRLLCATVRQKEKPSEVPKEVKVRNNHVFIKHDQTEWYAVDELILCGVLEHIKTYNTENAYGIVFKVVHLKQVSMSNHPRYKEFIKRFNEITKKKSRGDKESKKKFAESFEKYGMEDICKAIFRASKDQFHIDKELCYLTPEYILRDKILDRYLSMPDSKVGGARPIFSGN